MRTRGYLSTAFGCPYEGAVAVARVVELSEALIAMGAFEVAVSDNGSGIPTERLSELFDSFFTTQPEGMGVGLSIARSIVLAHGGRIWAANREGCGAVFTFTLRTAAPASELTTNQGK